MGSASCRIWRLFSAAAALVGGMLAAGAAVTAVPAFASGGSPDLAVTSLTVTGGTPQSTPIDDLFPLALTATARDAHGSPVPGATVIFTLHYAPGNVGGSFVEVNADTYSAPTGFDGIATAAVEANGNGGTWYVSACVEGLTSVCTSSTAWALTNTSGG